MKQPSGDMVDKVYLRLFRGENSVANKEISPIREGWVVFDVLDEVNHWKNQLAKHPHKKIHFHVVSYKTKNDFAYMVNGKDCHDSPIRFERRFQSSEIEDHQPLLMIYSYDPNTIKFNISALVENITHNSNTVNRYRRESGSGEDASSAPPPPCRKLDLSITLDEFNRIWALGDPTKSALAPRLFHLGLCGGQCQQDLPTSTKQHPIIIYYLSQQLHPAPSGFHWGQCCAPNAYKSIRTIFTSPNEEEYIFTELEDIAVESCGCFTFPFLNSR